MESTLSTATSLLSIAKTLNPSPNPLVSRLHRHLSSTRPGPLASLQVRRLFTTAKFRRPKPLNSVPYSSNSLRSLCAVGVHRLGCVGSSAASFASVAGGSGGGGGGIGESGGGGDGASDGGEAESNSGVGGAEEVSALSPDVIILDVGGMTCGGCAASVKRILESQSQVSSASVNLATETAIVWPVSEAKVILNWQKQLGETLAKHLTSCGFKSNLRGESLRLQLVDLLDGGISKSVDPVCFGYLLDALELSRLTMKTVKENLCWAFAYNMVGIPIAAGMLLPVTGTMLVQIYLKTEE